MVGVSDFVDSGGHPKWLVESRTSKRLLEQRDIIDDHAEGHRLVPEPATAKASSRFGIGFHSLRTKPNGSVVCTTIAPSSRKLLPA